MKRFFALCLTLCLLLSLCACAGSGTPGSEDHGTASVPSDAGTSLPGSNSDSKADSGISSPSESQGNPGTADSNKTDTNPTAPANSDSTQSNTQSSADIFGKYLIYSLETPNGSFTYEQLVQNGMSSAYLTLKADGSVETGAEDGVHSTMAWDKDNMVMESGGKVFTLSCVDGKLTVTDGTAINIYLHENHDFWKN